jgi:tRNA pseudouridine-54 N-methylase
LNVLSKVHNKLILFEVHVIRDVQVITVIKEAFKKANRERIDANKVAIVKKKEVEVAKKVERALQAVLREDNIEEIIVKEKAE